MRRRPCRRGATRGWWQLLFLLALCSRQDVADASTDLRIICQPCQSPDDCGDHTDICLIYPGVGDFCGMNCGTDADCAGLSCQPTEIDGLSQCVDLENYCRNGPPFECTSAGHCQPGERCELGRCVDDIRELGEECTADEQCESGRCDDTPVGRRCTTACDARLPLGGECPADLYCARGDSCEDGRCAPGAPGALALGEACTASVECASLFCLRPPGGEPTCLEPCLPPDGVCSAGTHCEEGTGACGLCLPDCTQADCSSGEVCFDGRCQALLPDGEACAEARQCLSLACQGGRCGVASEGDADPDRPPADGGPLGPETYRTECSCRAPGSSPGFGLALLLTLLSF